MNLSKPRTMSFNDTVATVAVVAAGTTVAANGITSLSKGFTALGDAVTENPGTSVFLGLAAIGYMVNEILELNDRDKHMRELLSKIRTIQSATHLTAQEKKNELTLIRNEYLRYS